MERIAVPDSIRPKGTVVISRLPPGFDPGTVLHTILRRRRGRLFLPDGTEVSGASMLKPEASDVLYASRQHIVELGRLRAAALIAGLSADYPDRVGAGDGGLHEDTTLPKAVPDDQTVLEHEVARQLVSQRILDEDAPSVTFVALFKTVGSFQFAQPGQSKISEIGLFARDGVMAAAHNFAPIPVDVHRIGIMCQWEWMVL